MVAQLAEVCGLETLNAQWSHDWEGWALLAQEVAVLKDLPEDLYIELAMYFIAPRLRHFLRLAEQHGQAPNFLSDKERVAELRALGWNEDWWRRGEVWGRNDCLADSLLQLLIHHGVLGVVSREQRNEACSENRRRLETSADA